MNHRLFFLICFSLSFAAPCGAAESAPAASIAVEAGLPNAPQPAELQFFGGTHQSLRAEIHGFYSGPIEITATLEQLADPLTADLPGAVQVLPEKSLQVSGTSSTGFDISLPAVRAETRFRLNFWARGGSASETIPVGGSFLRLYPRDILAPLRNWAKDHSLLVIDESSQLEQFLRKENIQFTLRESGNASGEIFRGGHPDLVMIVPGTASLSVKAAAKENAAAVIVFLKAPENTPVVRIRETETQKVIEQNASLLASIAENPGAQKSLMELFALSQKNEDKNT